MNPQDAIDLGREAIRACFMVGGPILLASLLIGLLVGVFQAMTQVQDQTVSFVPKLLCLLAVLGLCLPWLTDQMVEYGEQAWAKPITHFHVWFSNHGHRAIAISVHANRRPQRHTAAGIPTTWTVHPKPAAGRGTKIAVFTAALPILTPSEKEH